MTDIFADTSLSSRSRLALLFYRNLTSFHTFDPGYISLNLYSAYSYFAFVFGH